MTAALEGGEWSAARSGRTLPPGKTRYPFYRKLGGPQGRSGRAENLVPTGIRSQAVQPVAHSLYRLSYPAHYLLFKSHKITRSAHFRVIVPDTKRLFPEHHRIILPAPGNASLQLLCVLCLSHFVLVTHSACFSIPFPRASNNKRNTTHTVSRGAMLPLILN